MNKERLKKFKKAFEAQKKSLLFNDKIIREDFGVNSDDRYDEIDQATTDMEQSMRMRLRNRESLYLKKLDEALQRIEQAEQVFDEACAGDVGSERVGGFTGVDEVFDLVGDAEAWGPVSVEDFGAVIVEGP